MGLRTLFWLLTLAGLGCSSGVVTYQDAPDASSTVLTANAVAKYNLWGSWYCGAGKSYEWTIIPDEGLMLHGFSDCTYSYTEGEALSFKCTKKEEFQLYTIKFPYTVDFWLAVSAVDTDKYEGTATWHVWSVLDYKDIDYTTFTCAIVYDVYLYRR